MAFISGWKEIGNQRYRAKDFEGAIVAYNRGLAESSTTDLLCNKCAALLKIGAYQEARETAQEALRIDETHPNHVKTRYRLATALYLLRSYAPALEVLRPVKDDPSIRPLFERLLLCVQENQRGQYDFWAINEEVKVEPRLSHADYCSSLIEVRKSKFGGKSRRGVFAKTRIPQGTLIVASKSIACSYFDEHENAESLSDAERDDLVEHAIASDIQQIITKGHYGLAVLNLPGGIHGRKLDIDLRKDDVHDEPSEIAPVTEDEIIKIVRQNTFKVWKAVNSVDIVHGQALFYFPSFFNHNCIPNTDRAEIGDMMFIRASTTIPANTEIFTTLVNGHDAHSVQDRAEDLRKRCGRRCDCSLCDFERGNPDIVNPMIELGRRMLAKYPDPRGADAIEELRAARRELYNHYDFPEPAEEFTIQRLKVDAPRYFAFARVAQIILSLLASALKQEVRALGPSAVREAALCYREMHAIAKGNYYLWRERLSEAPYPALYVSMAVVMDKDPRLSRKWLEESEKLGLLFLGKEWFESEYSHMLGLIRSMIKRLEKGITDAAPAKCNDFGPRNRARKGGKEKASKRLKSVNLVIF